MKLSMSSMEEPEKTSFVQPTEMNPANVEPALDIVQVHDIVLSMYLHGTLKDDISYLLPT